VSVFVCSSCGSKEDFIIKNGLPAPPETWAIIKTPYIQFFACCEMCCYRLKKQFHAFFTKEQGKLAAPAAEQIVKCIEMIQQHLAGRDDRKKKDTPNTPKT